MKRIENLGAGEILLNSVEKDGKANGYDIETISKASDTLKIPVIACGGAGLAETLFELLLDTRASGLLPEIFFILLKTLIQELKSI